MQESRRTYLLEQYKKGVSSFEEKRELWELVRQSESEAWLKDEINHEILQAGAFTEPFPVIIKDTDAQEVLHTILDKNIAVPVHRIHFLKTSWFRYAAAIIIVIGGAALWYTQSGKSAKSVQSVSSVIDIAPGTNRAILTVGNKTIDLATNKTGIAVESVITYNDGEKIADAGELLQLSTPRGGQYQATLPDGSKVWLNAASSIKFPSKFANNTREVEITGEVYLEIAKNSKQPFYVHTNKTTIQVLGTSFNMNAYEDEGALKTTLIDGSVKVLVQDQGKILKPGQQAVVTRESISVQSADMEQALAWRNGLFHFNQMPLAEALRQLARWYNVDIVYEKTVPDIKFWGEIKRDLTLLQVLDALGEVGVKFRIEGRKLIVL